MAEYQRVRVEEVGEVTVVHFRERRFLDNAAIEDLGRELYRLAEDPNRRKLLLDFSGVELFSSAAFGKLIKLNGNVRANGGSLRLCNVPKHILDVFRICKLDRIFDIRDDESDALLAFSSPSHG